MENKIIIICSPSAGGKDTLARLLEKDHGYNFIVSTTTRPMRDGESERNPYRFVDNAEFERLISENELIEYREYHTLVNNIPATWYYGVENKEVDPSKSYVVVLDTVGLREFKSHFPDKVISFFINVSDEVRKERCLSRGDFDEFEWNRRLEDDKIRFSDDIVNNEMDFVINGDQEPKEVLSDVLKRISNHMTFVITEALFPTAPVIVAKGLSKSDAKKIYKYISDTYDDTYTTWSVLPSYANDLIICNENLWTEKSINDIRSKAL